MNEYTRMHEKYCGFPCSDVSFDVEIPSKIIFDLKQGKAADIDGLSNERLIFCHPILPMIFFRRPKCQIILRTRYIPSGCNRSYIAHIPKPKDVLYKAMACNDFRVIAISPVISKFFEHCFLSKYNSICKESPNANLVR